MRMLILINLLLFQFASIGQDGLYDNSIERIEFLDVIVSAPLQSKVLIGDRLYEVAESRQVMKANRSGSSNSRSFASRSELGVLIGGSYYTGDLNRMGHFQQIEPAGGLVFRYNVHSRLALRVNALYGNVKGDDKLSPYEFQRNRNLSFRSPIIELAIGFEFNYFQYEIGNSKYWITSYMFGGVGGFYMNPKANYNGQWVELRQLGTEGQGTPLSNDNPYSLTQLCIPMGLGVKMNVGKRVAISFEYGLRLTFTDYIDDVSGNYVDSDALAQINGTIAAELSDRSLVKLGHNGSNAGYRRGDPNNKDWYSFFGMMISFQLGNPGTCWSGR